MRRSGIAGGVILVCAASVLLAAAFAGEPPVEEEKKIPIGMEEIEFGKIKMILPKGMKTKKHGSHITLEDQNEFLARRLQEMEDRISTFGDLIKKIDKDIGDRNTRIERKLEVLGLSMEQTRKVLLKLTEDEEEKE